MVTTVATVRGRSRHQLLELQWSKLPKALDRTANSVGTDGSKCRAAGQLLTLDRPERCLNEPDDNAEQRPVVPPSWSGRGLSLRSRGPVWPVGLARRSKCCLGGVERLRGLCRDAKLVCSSAPHPSSGLGRHLG